MLKLPKLPDRTPVRLTVAVSPDLHQRLQSYAVLYRETYGEVETVAELIPYMLGVFLDSDRVYVKLLKQDLSPAEASPRSRSRKAGANTSPAQKT